MSQVDKALRIVEHESGVTVSEPPAVVSGHSSLTQYNHENQGAASRVQTADSIPRLEYHDSNAPQKAQNRVKTIDVQRAVIPNNEELQARLVTKTISTVSLEQYRRVAAVLLEAQLQKQTKTVMVTSSLPGEGKTLTAVNLALTLSESYARRVLLIDADLRSSSLHALLDLPIGRGLGDALSDGTQTLPITAVSDRFSVLTAGAPGPEPLAGLSSPRMAQILEECSGRFDWVLVDTPPAGVLPDAQVLARHVGEVILVIAAGSTPDSAVRRAVTELGGPEAITGVVLNRVDERRIPDAGYYGQYRSRAAS